VRGEDRGRSAAETIKELPGTANVKCDRAIALATRTILMETLKDDDWDASPPPPSYSKYVAARTLHAWLGVSEAAGFAGAVGREVHAGTACEVGTRRGCCVSLSTDPERGILRRVEAGAPLVPSAATKHRLRSRRLAYVYTQTLRNQRFLIAHSVIPSLSSRRMIENTVTPLRVRAP
jgi:hypothetical protein